MFTRVFGAGNLSGIAVSKGSVTFAVGRRMRDSRYKIARWLNESGLLDVCSYRSFESSDFIGAGIRDDFGFMQVVCCTYLIKTDGSA